MSLDALSVVAVFVGAAEVLLGFATIVFSRRDAALAARGESAPRLTLTGATLVLVAAAAWPVHYLLLESWVPRWPGVMCIEGVRRIGAGTTGAASWLPHLLHALDATKPLLLLAAGSWLLLSRAGASRARRAARAAVLLGTLAIVDGAFEAAYVAIPKELVPPNAGCCTSALPGDDGPSLAARLGAAVHVGVTFPVVAFLLSAAAFAVRRGARRILPRIALAAASITSVPIGFAFLTEVAGPRAAGLSNHPCAWCSLRDAPEILAGVLLFGAAVSCAVWSVAASPWNRDESETSSPFADARLLLFACFGFLGTAAMAASFSWCP